MKKIDLEDTVRILKDYIKLMWSIHETYAPSTNPEDNSVYKVGIETFLLACQEAINNLEDEEESE